MKAWDVEQDEERESVVSASDIVKGSRLPKMPDLSAGLVPVRRPSPFILDDFRGSNAYKETQP